MNQAHRIYELNRLNRGDIYRDNIFAFASGKGGTGKTFITLNLALSLAKKGLKVLLVDLDINFANVHILLNQTPSATLYKYFSSEMLLEDIIQNYSTNLDIVYGDSGRKDYPQINEFKINYLFESIKQLADRYDFVFIDCASGGTDENLAVFKSAGKLVLIVTPEPTSVMDGYVLVKLLNEYKADVQKFAIINKAADTAEGEDTFENLNKATFHFLKENVEFSGIIGLSFDIPKSINSQNPLVISKPESTVSAQLNLISEKFEKITQLANNNHS